MAGPAIRAWQFAAALCAEHDVELVTTAACSLDSDGRFAVRHLDDPAELLARTDVWVVQGSVLLDHPAIARSDATVVVDLYDPYHLENLENSRGLSHRDRLAKVHNATAVLNSAIRRGDFFLAASGKQRDFWLGALASLGRVNPLTYDADGSLSSLIDLVPFGVDDVPPQHTRAAIRGVIPGIGADDVLLLWGGGIYNWFDPLTLIRAVQKVRETRDDVRLLFLGGKHPNPAVPAMQMAAASRALADELGLTGTHVFFNEGWVPYDERGSFLLEADIGVSTHLDHIETAFSFRTRVLDYLWAGLPVVATDGDVFADVIASRGIGATVPPGDVDALAEALLSLVEDDARREACASASRALAEEYRWDRALAPLLAFCRDPRRAPDLTDKVVQLHLAQPFDVVRAPTPGPSGWRGEVALAKQYLDRGGAGLLARRVANRAGKLLRGRTS
ncbi:MAG: glycosyl transferase family 2 [Frankiales bacterium]|nr:glycosyl transferase family 2 [Frankiales bacterium]